MLLRRDFVQNSNDSAWLTNPASPLQGFSPLVSQEKPIGPRARYALSRLQGKQPLEAKTLEEMVTANHVFSADQVLPDLLRLCRDDQGENSLPVPARPWRSGTVAPDLDSGSGFVYFQRFMQRFAELDGAWKEPFDAQRPWIRRKASPSTGRRWRPRCARRWRTRRRRWRRAGFPTARAGATCK